MRWMLIALLAVLFAGSGCAADRVATAPEQSPAPPAAAPTETPAQTPTDEPSASAIAWLDTPLTDAVTGKEFKLSDYKGKPVLLHAFATW